MSEVNAEIDDDPGPGQRRPVRGGLAVQGPRWPSADGEAAAGPAIARRLCRADEKSTGSSDARPRRGTCGATTPRPRTSSPRSPSSTWPALRANAAAMTRRAAGQADPGGQQVGALPGADQPGAGDGRVPRASWPSRCPRRSGWPEPGPATTSWWPTRRRTGRAGAAGRRPGGRSGHHRDGRLRRAPRHDREDHRSTRWRPQPVRVCIDIDTAYIALGGRLRVGARRSPVRTPADAAALATAIVSRPGLRLAGLMAYEGQIAGVGDNPAGRPLYAPRHPVHAAQVRGRTGQPARGDRRGGPGGGAAGVRQRRRHRLGREDDGRGGGHRDRRRIRALPAPGCSTATAASPACPRRSSRCPWSAGRGRAWSPRSAAAISRPAPANASRLPMPYLPAGLRLDKRGGRGRGADPAARPGRRRAAGSATGSGSGTPRRASCASGSRAAPDRGRRGHRDRADVPGRRPDLRLTATGGGGRTCGRRSG